MLAKCSEQSGAKHVPNVPNVPHVPNVPNTNIVPGQHRGSYVARTQLHWTVSIMHRRTAMPAMCGPSKKTKKLLMLICHAATAQPAMPAMLSLHCDRSEGSGQ